MAGRLSYDSSQSRTVDGSNMRQYYDRLAAPMLRDAARTYLNPDRYVEVTLLPEAR
jgi:hypothetical protein